METYDLLWLAKTSEIMSIWLFLIYIKIRQNVAALDIGIEYKLCFLITFYAILNSWSEANKTKQKCLEDNLQG